MKKLVLVIMLLKGLTGVLSAQKVTLIKSVENAKKGGVTEYYNPIAGKGFIYIRELRGSHYNATLFDYDFKEVWNKEQSISGIKSMSFYTSQSSDKDFSVYFYKKRYLGFFPVTKFKEIVFNNSNGDITKYRYRIRNYTFPTGMYKINGKTLLTGVECYKPWHPWRIIRFGTPLAAAFAPEAPVLTAILAGVGVPSFYTWMFPTTPRTRPAFVELKEGKALYINRKMYKKKYYKNKGIHAFEQKDGQYYMGITNAIRHGRDPIVVDRYDSLFNRISTFRVETERKQRISAFFFDSLSADTVKFHGSYGNKIVTSVGALIRMDPYRSNTQAFDGEISEGKINVENSTNIFRNEDANEVYKKSRQVMVNSITLRQTVNGEDIEFTLFENFVPDIDVVVTTTHSDRGSSTRYKYILRGYYVRALRLNIHNYTRDTFGVIENFSDFTHYESPERFSPSLMHSCLQIFDNQVYLHYVAGNDQLNSFIVNPFTYKLSTVAYNKLLASATDDASVYYAVLPMDKNRIMVAVDLYAKRDSAGKKKDVSERRKSIFNLYETRFDWTK